VIDVVGVDAAADGVDAAAVGVADAGSNSVDCFYCIVNFDYRNRY